jgi:hypothetical protein
MRATLFLYFIVSAGSVLAQQEQKARPSPLAIASVRYKDNYVKITYSQPRKKGREIFGGLVPFGQVWRTGANEATEITTVTDIEFGGMLLTAGTYSLFTIPEKEQWTVIVNSDVGLWGAYNYNSNKDVFRFAIPVATADNLYEAFTMRIESQNEVASLLMMWDRARISIPIRFLN